MSRSVTTDSNWVLDTPGGWITIGSYQDDGLAPEHLVYFSYRHADEPLPLVVFLHGSEERGTDARSLCCVGPFAALHDGLRLAAIIAAPQCPLRQTWKPNAIRRFITFVSSSYPVDPRRVYLIGHSLGANGVWLTAAAYPDLFAAIVPISGEAHPHLAQRLTETPIAAFHGTDDKIIAARETQQMIEKINTAGGSALLALLPDCGHDICGQVCRNPALWHWLVTQPRRQLPDR